jgi:hypothetical protein
MRFAIVCSLLVLVACGGAAKPAQTESNDTASLDPKGSESGGGSASSASSASGDSTSASSSASTPASDSAPRSGGATGGQEPASGAAAPASLHPVPAATGSIDGKPFVPKLAQISSKIQKDGRVAIVLHEGTDCVAQPGDASMTLMVTWKDGYKVDVGSLKRAKGGNLGEAAFVHVDDKKKKNVSSTFKPTGLVTIVSAPTDKDAVGKIKIDLQSGDYMLAGDLDVKLCTAAK